MELLDTSVAVDHLRGRAEATAVIDRASRADELVASELVRFELLSGVRDEERPALEGFFAVLGWLEVDERVARVAGALARRYRRSHGGIGDSDYLIAATALVFDAELLTTNVRRFPMLEGLTAPYGREGGSAA